MKSKINHKFLSIALVFLLKHLVAITYSLTPLQMAASDLKKIRNYYETHPTITVETSYKAYEDFESMDLKEAKNGLFVKNGNMSYLKTMNVEIITTDSDVLSVDHDDKRIFVSDVTNIGKTVFTNNLDTLLLFCESVEYKNTGQNERKYTLYFDKEGFSEYAKIDYYVDTRSYRFTRIVLYFSVGIDITNSSNNEPKKPRLEIIYTNYRESIADNALLRRSTYLLENRGKLEAVGKYRFFKVIDQRKKTYLKGE